MSTASLPVYQGLPSYTAEPRWSERRIALNQPYRPTRYSAEFVKQSRNGGVSLRLAQHENNLDAPAYGGGEVIKGTVELLKTDNVTSVEVKVQHIICYSSYDFPDSPFFSRSREPCSCKRSRKEAILLANYVRTNMFCGPRVLVHVRHRFPSARRCPQRSRMVTEPMSVILVLYGSLLVH